MNKIYYQCEHCVHFLHHYVICEDMLHKTSCGHCVCRNKDFKVRQRNCQYFEELTPTKEKVQKEQNALYTLKQVNKTLKQLKLYLYNFEQEQKVDACVVERFKR